MIAGRGGLGVLIVGFLALQLVPYGRSHTNPAVRGEPPWSSQQTRDLFARACKDCHSNETSWPGYSDVAPISWVVQRDVDQGRYQLNVSSWPSGSGEAQHAAEEVQRGSMPPRMYLLLHPDARLNDDDRRLLIEGLVATFGSEGRSGLRD